MVRKEKVMFYVPAAWEGQMVVVKMVSGECLEGILGPRSKGGEDSLVLQKANNGLVRYNETYLNVANVEHVSQKEAQE